MALPAEEFFVTVSEIQNDCHLLETKVGQLDRFDLLTPRHKVSETLRELDSTSSRISSRIHNLKIRVAAAKVEDNVVFTPHCRVLELRLRAIERSQKRKASALNQDEIRFQAEWNDQSITTPGSDRLVQRTQNATNYASNVSQRSKDLKKIEFDMQELATIYNDLEVAVQDQDPVVEKIELRSNDAVTHIPKAVANLKAGVRRARTRNQTLLWVIGVVITILVAGAIVSIIVVKVVLK